MTAETPTVQSMFARQSAGADASRAAAMAVALWKNVGRTLSPIIGQAGVDALFKRSIYLSRGAQPCLASVFDNPAQPDALAALQTAFAQQPGATAVAANIVLLQNFQDLLTSLIGLSLTERLLRLVWD
ncbi:MAG: hypothetical protein ABI128_02610, partial [Rhodanobacter sp.]